eukprot:3794676-Amphidinium_carterae.1
MAVTSSFEGTLRRTYGYQSWNGITRFCDHGRSTRLEQLHLRALRGKRGARYGTPVAEASHRAVRLPGDTERIGCIGLVEMPITEPDADDVENLQEMKPAAAKRLERVQCLLP